jgi:ribosomal protein S18 acetylase RimI-like enzyme
MRIRPAIPADEPAVRACAEAAYAQYVGAIGRTPAPMLADFAAQIRDGLVHVAVGNKGQVEGYVVYYPHGDAMHLENVAVLPSAAGRGIGKALVGQCEAAAREAGMAAVDLYTNAKMTANLSIYPYLGYRETGRRHEDGFDRVFFRKDLTARGRGG